MQNTLLVSLSLSLVSMPFNALKAQRPNADESIAIMTAAATYARNSHPDERIVMVDVDSTVPSKASLASAIAKLIRDGLPGKPDIVCQGTRNSCHLRGAGLALRIAAPVMRGDTAEVTIRTWQETSSKRQSVYRSESIVTVIRRGGGWRATGSRTIWET